MAILLIGRNNCFVGFKDSQLGTVKRLFVIPLLTGNYDSRR